MIGRKSLPGKERLLAVSALGDRRQRRLLDVLRDRSLPLTERDLAAELAAKEEDKPLAEVTAEERQERQLLLHRQYLPKFEAAGIIERRPDGVVSAWRFPFPEPNSRLPHTHGPNNISGATDRVQVHLERALAASEASEKNFHIRSALQSLLVIPESPD